MSAGHQQQEIGKGDIVSQARGQGMGFQMIDGDERQFPRRRQGLARHHADQHPADQARARRGGDGIDPVPADARLRQGRFDHRVDLIQMGAGRDLGHNPGEGLVLGQLLMNHVGQHLASVADDGGGGFVTTGFDAQNSHVDKDGQFLGCGNGRGLYSVARRTTKRLFQS